MFLRALRKILTVSFIGAFLVIFIIGYSRARNQRIGLDVQPVGPTPTPNPSPSSTPNPISTPTPAPERATYTGTTYRIPWGNVTVAIDVQGGKIVDIRTPDIPNDSPSRYAQPLLIEQALRAGSANIQGVSGATYTSLAFEHSLESALVQANIR
ncbi:MAG TPA: FMN-binding protein [Candidatus Paceibacterota bacterium]|nr:FMN-binding protein [Candidatus Paceibacterota bacterium]